MIFKPDLATKIKGGDKTAHRQPVKRGEWVCPHQPGQVRKVQPARQRGDFNRPPRHICRIDILTVTRDILGEITDTDARAEGFPDWNAYIEHWAATVDHVEALDVDLDQPVWVITFQLHTPDTARREPPLFLHKGIIGGAGEPVCDYDALAERGYTTDPAAALTSAGEVIDTSRTASSFEAAKRYRDEKAAQARAVAEMPLSERVERAISDARLAGVDTKRYEVAITARLRSLEQRTRNAA